MASARVEGSRVGVEVEVAVAPGAPLGQIESEGGTAVGYGIACGGTDLVAGVPTEAGDVMAGTVDGWFGWRTGLDVGIGGAVVKAGRWRG